VDTGWHAFGPDPGDMVTVRGLQLQVDVDPGVVWRVGYRPDPWAWTPWQYAVGGRFGGRWDDPAGEFRTVYAGGSLLGCLLEVLAPFRPDLVLAEVVEGIEEDPVDAEQYPTGPSGRVPRDWLLPRVASTARLTGRYVAVSHMYSLGSLRQRFRQLARRLGLPDLDASALKAAQPRELTQTIARWLYRSPADPDSRPVDGVRFDSRHDDGIALWAVFEQPGDPAVSPQLTDPAEHPLTDTSPDLLQALATHRLTWAD
jgi:hypothetical protein